MIGSISSGTLRAEDLLVAFADTLEQLEKEAGEPRSLVISEARTIAPDSAEDIIADLIDALDAHAPPYCYFGAAEGDGADFGFWPSIDQLPKVADPGEVAEVGEDCIFVNDHGNVTLYGADGKIVWEIV